MGGHHADDDGDARAWTEAVDHEPRGAAWLAPTAAIAVTLAWWREVRLPGTDGDLTAMPGHAPAIVTLRPGMAFSVEPGIYVAGQWGMRIEDIVVVTADGCESMNNRPHGLTVL